jgi:hypothetical protein
MRAITRGLWRAWAAGLPGGLIAIWLVGLITPGSGSGYAHADALNWARCSACGGICRVLGSETRCAGCQAHPEREVRGGGAPARQVRRHQGSRTRGTLR